jgi:general secretion pathway protein A
MYTHFFGLQQEPFSIAPDPRYLFMSERHREALAHLLYGVRSGGGFVLLTGEIGAGKTTVCRCFLEQVPRHCNVAYIFNPKQTVEELLESICDEFRIPHVPEKAAPTTVKQHVDVLNEFLLRTHAVGQNNVLVVDEAQLLSADVLEQLRLLTNLETSERKLLQIILIGQPELRKLLARPELEQLAQRVIARYHLKALSESETKQYIQHRLAVAGLSTALPFNARALQRIHALAQGVPRRINLLCDRALLGAYASGQSMASAQIVDKAAAEVLGKTTRRAAPHASPRPGVQGLSPRWRGAALLGLGLVLGALLFGAATLALDMVRQPAATAAAQAGAQPGSKR